MFDYSIGVLKERIKKLEAALNSIKSFGIVDAKDEGKARDLLRQYAEIEGNLMDVNESIRILTELGAEATSDEEIIIGQESM